MVNQNTNWGVRPILFKIWEIPISSYSFFVLLGLFVGLLVYRIEAKKVGKSKNDFTIVLASIVGGVVGAKLFDFVIYYKVLLSQLSVPETLISGRTIIGGLIGGTIGVLIIKKIKGIKEKRGNLFAPAIALGVAIGRLGCFFAGCCFGKPTSLPWGVNFGDGIMRHPTQIYESLFMLGMFFILNKIKKNNPKPGELFKILMISYFTFRFFIEFIRVEKIAFLGLTFFQIISIFAIIYLTRRSLLNSFKIIYERKN